MNAMPHIESGAAVGALLFSLRVIYGAQSKKQGLIIPVVLTFILGFASHFILDAIPHTEYERYEDILAHYGLSITPKLDCLLMIILETLLAFLLLFKVGLKSHIGEFPRYFLLLIGVGIFSASLPDLRPHGLAESGGSLSQINSPFWHAIFTPTYFLHHHFHTRIHISFLAGIVTQVFTSAISLYVVRTVCRRLRRPSP